MDKYGLIGYPLGHSFSISYFNQRFHDEDIDAVYENFEIPTIDILPEVLSQNPELKGLNVTIPYKEKVIPFLDSISPEARAIGAVNVIRVIHEGKNIKLKGYNSDVIGFTQSIEPMLEKKWHKKALILGTGGASKAIDYGLRNLGLETVFVSRYERPGTIQYERITPEVVKEYNVIVNCTPLGMYPKTEECPLLPYERTDWKCCSCRLLPRGSSGTKINRITMAEYIEKIDELTRQYNDAINALEDSYNMESSQVSGLQILTSSKLKHQYSKKYEELAKEYLGKRKEIFEEYKKNNPEWTKNRKIWGWMFIIGIICAMVCCGASLPSSEEPASAVASQAVSNNQEATLWNADNIPIPYLQDSTQYVSNPDYVLKQETVDKMNVTLKRLENELGVQSVVIVVNNIENDDPFRFAQEVGNKYGVGYGNKGLVVVVGYQDHSINISPGRALEADLTDAECHRLEQEYVVPAMRAEMPDSAMYYLTEAIYSTLQKKELPQMSNLLGDSGEDDGLGTIGLTTLAIIAWCVFFLRKNREYHWLGMAGAASLLANPFYEASHSSGGGGFGGFSGGGGHFGGGGGGGHFGGGSFGGGGATSRW